MLEGMQRVYAAAKIQVRLISTEELELPELADLHVGDCVSEVTSDQVALFSHRGIALANDVIAFFCRTLIPPVEGCATHPRDQPGVVLSQSADLWALAHEVGHLLGLSHVDDDDCLMTGNGTVNITNPPPKLTRDEIGTMRDSSLVTILSKSARKVRALLDSHLPYEEKLTRLPKGGPAQLAALAASGESAIACKAVHLASLLREDAAERVVANALGDPLPEVRVAAAAAVANLAPDASTRLRKLAMTHDDDCMRRALEKTTSVSVSGRTGPKGATKGSSRGHP